MRGEGALGAGRRPPAVAAGASPAHVLVAEARLAAQARVLPEAVARLALVGLRLEHLARGLVLELVVLAEEAAAEAAAEHAAAVLPHAALALEARRVGQRAGAGVRGEALAPVAHPRLAVVADGADHAEPRRVHARVAHHAVARLQHALHLAAVRARRQPLHRLAEVAERAALLLSANTRTDGRISCFDVYRNLLPQCLPDLNTTYPTLTPSHLNSRCIRVGSYSYRIISLL